MVKLQTKRGALWKLLKTRRRLPVWGILSILLTMAIGFTLYNWFLVGQDEAIASRERTVLGSIYRTTRWKQSTAFYSFTYAGREYKGSEIVGPDKMCICDVAVYFDPERPSTNTLVEYRRKKKQDHSMMVGCGYASLALGVGLVCAWALKRRTDSAKEV